MWTYAFVCKHQFTSPKESELKLKIILLFHHQMFDICIDFTLTNWVFLGIFPPKKCQIWRHLKFLLFNSLMNDSFLFFFGYDHSFCSLWFLVLRYISLSLNINTLTHISNNLHFFPHLPSVTGSTFSEISFDNPRN